MGPGTAVGTIIGDGIAAVLPITTIIGGAGAAIGTTEAPPYVMPIGGLIAGSGLIIGDASAGGIISGAEPEGTGLDGAGNPENGTTTLDSKWPLFAGLPMEPFGKQQQVRPHSVSVTHQQLQWRPHTPPAEHSRPQTAHPQF